MIFPSIGCLVIAPSKQTPKSVVRFMNAPTRPHWLGALHCFIHKRQRPRRPRAAERGADEESVWGNDFRQSIIVQLLF
jgi:hypothetical protein